MPSDISNKDAVTREILIGFWKVHILHHAEEGPIYGQWIAEELRRHGYNISPGTLYPMLKRMEANGWLRSKPTQNAARNARKEYTLTREGRKVLEFLRSRVKELRHEVEEKSEGKSRKHE